MRLRPSITVLLACLVWPPIALAQTAPAFTVASIKLGDGDIVQTRPQLTPGRIVWTADFPYLIAWACNSDIQWVRGTFPKEHYTYRIEATFDPSATDMQVRAMLLSLLETRFGMVAHRAGAEQTGYALLIAKGGLKIHESKPDDSGAPVANAGRIWATLPTAGVAEITGNQVSVAQLTMQISRLTRAQVWDKTGLTGIYDFHFRAALDDASLTDNLSTYPRIEDVLRQESPQD